METFEEQKRYERAQKKVKDEKGFYAHLTIYIVMNAVILFVNTNFESQGFKDWSQWHLYVTPVFWGIWLFFHWVKVFGKIPFLSKDWEERKIKKILEEEDLKE